MWVVEARNWGPLNKDYFYMSGLTEQESKQRHKDLFNSGKWAMVRSYKYNSNEKKFK